MFAGYMRKRRIALGMRSSKGIGRAVALSFARSKYYFGIVTSSRKREQGVGIRRNKEFT